MFLIYPAEMVGERGSKREWKREGSVTCVFSMVSDLRQPIWSSLPGLLSSWALLMLAVHTDLSMCFYIWMLADCYWLYSIALCMSLLVLLITLPLALLSGAEEFLVGAINSWNFYYRQIVRITCWKWSAGECLLTIWVKKWPNGYIVRTGKSSTFSSFTVQPSGLILEDILKTISGSV